MNVHTLLQQLAALDIKVEPSPLLGRLRVDAPQGRLTTDLRAELERHKPELLAWLAQSTSDIQPETARYTAPLVPVQQTAREMRLPSGDAVDHGLHHVVLLREADLAALVDEIMSDPTNSVIAVDAEWHGAHPCNQGSYVRTVQLSRKPRHAACVVLRDAGGVACFTPSIDSAIPHLRRLFTSSAVWPVRIAGHFFRADLPWLLSLGLDLREQFEAPVTVTGDDVAAWQDTRNRGGFDTGLAAHACNETGDFGLKASRRSIRMRPTMRRISRSGRPPTAKSTRSSRSSWPASATARMKY